MEQQMCFALPIIAGRTEDARTFMRELEGPRAGAFDQSERRLGVTKESWFLQNTPQGDLLIVYMESADFAKAFQMFSESRDEFDVWFKSGMGHLTGIDLNGPPHGPLSEQLSRYPK